MTVQLSLIQDDRIKKTIQNVPIGECTISSFNPRITRTDEEIDKLAQRMARNGFEVTRAPWAYRNGNGYEVFAGGTRLEAARRAAITEVPVVLHEGLTDEEIVRLAEQDNENDEYHTRVPLVDQWLSYRALDDLGWQKQQIAGAKNVNPGLVTQRLKYAQFPQSILDIFFKNDFLKESHAYEIDQTLNFKEGIWLTRDQALIHIMTTVLAKTQKPTATDFKIEVDKLNTIIQMVQSAINGLEEKWQSELLSRLATYKDKGLSLSSAQRAIDIVTKQVAEEKRRLEEEARAIAKQAEQERIAAERKERIARLRELYLSRIVLGDARQEIQGAPDGIKLVFTDPPYGIDFQSNRRVQKEKADKLEGDETPDTAIRLLRDVLDGLYPKMADDSTLLIWTSWANYSEFREVIAQAGFTLKSRPILWEKPNHSCGDLEGDYAPDTEVIIFAVKGNPKLFLDIEDERKRPTQRQPGKEFVKTEHPTPKPVDLISRLIEYHTREDDWVIDPFAGIGSTVLAAMRSNRKFWACEIEEKWHTEVRNLLIPEIEKKIKKEYADM